MTDDAARWSRRNKLVKKRRAERSLPKTKKSPKNRLRDLRRRLQREAGKEDGGNSKVRSRLEAEIEALAAEEEGRSATRRRVQVEKKFALKYHKVKFFERQKVNRKLSRVRIELARNPESAELLREEQRLLEDLDYIRYYPKAKKYVSLLVDRDDDTKSPQIRAKMREIALATAREARRSSEEATRHEDIPEEEEDEGEEDDFFLKEA